MQANVEIQAGICGFITNVSAESEDSQNVNYAIKSNCEKIAALAIKLNKIQPVDAFQEISPTGEGKIIPVVRETLKGCCAGCAVPAGIFKAMQVAAGLALPKDISIAFK